MIVMTREKASGSFCSLFMSFSRLYYMLLRQLISLSFDTSIRFNKRITNTWRAVQCCTSPVLYFTSSWHSPVRLSTP